MGCPQDLIMSRSFVASCGPWLPFAAQINGCLERGARRMAGTSCRAYVSAAALMIHTLSLFWQWARRLPTVTDSDSSRL
jgi:hypothetical protein